MDGPKIYKTLLDYKRGFCSRYLNDFGYNLFYGKALTDNDGVKPSLPYVSFWFIIEFDLELREFLIQHNVEVPVLYESEIKKLANRCKEIPQLMCNDIREFCFDKEKFYYILDDLLALYINKLYEYFVEKKTDVSDDGNIKKHFKSAFDSKKRRNKKTSSKVII